MSNKIFYGLLFLIVIFSGCSSKKGLKLATTTSLEASGLLDELLPIFEKKYKIKVKVLAVGTGNALKLAERGDVDVIWVHSPEQEEAFMKAGFGKERKNIMFNDFIIVGPKEDPAGIRNSKSGACALKKISQHKSLFVSRGDNSGTHLKELSLFRKAGVSPHGRWYIETGQGMLETLLIANEKNAYCLVDRATFISNAHMVNLDILFEHDHSLINIYSVITTNPILHPHINYREAKLFIDFLSSSKGGKFIINKYKKNGKSLFSAYN